MPRDWMDVHERTPLVSLATLSLQCWHTAQTALWIVRCSSCILRLMCCRRERQRWNMARVPKMEYGLLARAVRAQWMRMRPTPTSRLGNRNNSCTWARALAPLSSRRSNSRRARFPVPPCTKPRSAPRGRVMVLCGRCISAVSRFLSGHPTRVIDLKRRQQLWGVSITADGKRALTNSHTMKVGPGERAVRRAF